MAAQFIYRTIRISLLALALAAFVWLLLARTATSAPALRYTIVVNTIADEYDLSGSGTGCSLREAIRTANDGADFGGCVRDVTVGFSPDTILLPSATYTLTLAGPPEDLDVSGDLDIRRSVIISATGATSPTVRGGSGWADRIFSVLTGTVTIKGLAIHGGAVSGSGGGVYVEAGAALSLTDGEIAGNNAYYGGGVFNRGTLTLANTYVANNTAQLSDGGGIWANGSTSIDCSTFYSNTALSGLGGGIYNEGALGMTHSTFDRNDAQQGGAIHTSGFLNVSNSEFRGNHGYGSGGAILVQTTVANIDHTVFDENSGGLGGAVLVTGTAVLSSSLTTFSDNFGGALAVFSGSLLKLWDSTIEGNRESYLGGGIDSEDSTTALTRVTISRNTATLDGGGLYDKGGTTTLSQGTVSGNTASSGGGIYNQSGTLILLNSTVSRNTATLDGGGTINNVGTATLTNVTLSGNSAKRWGGGFFNFRAAATLVNVTLGGNSGPGGGSGMYHFSDNTSQNISLQNTLVANGQSGGNCYRDPASVGGSTIVSLGYNLSSDATCTANFNQTGDLNGANPNLGPLANNGGPTQTQIPFPPSQALDAIPLNANGCGATVTADERGVARPQGPKCDIGAVEYLPGEKSPWLYLPLVLR